MKIALRRYAFHSKYHRSTQWVASVGAGPARISVCGRNPVHAIKFLRLMAANPQPRNT